MKAKLMHKLKISHPITYSRGNTAAEYGMIGAIIVAASVGIFMVLGSGIDQVFSKLQGQNKLQVSKASTALSTQYSNQASFGAGMQNLTGNALLNGANNGAVLQVSAANGNLESLSAKQLTLIFGTPPAQLSQPDILAMERDMSNRSFQIAQLEQKVQSLLDFSNNNPSQFMTTNLTYNGQTSPAIALTIGLQYESQALIKMQDYLNATNATAADKQKMNDQVNTVSALAAAIYSKTQTMQSQYQKQLADAQAAKAAQAFATVITTPSNQQAGTQAAQAFKDAAATQQVSQASSASASSAASSAAAVGAPTDTSGAVAVTDTSATVMCTTGTGQANNQHCQR